MSKPLVTAVVLSYNTGEWTIKTIQSIQNNGYENVEIICIDDASTDTESQQLLQDFHQKTNFGDLIINPTNLGIPASANKGLALSKGKYFFIVGDDYLLPGKINADVEILEASSEDTVLVHSIMQYANFDFSLKYPHFSPTYNYPETGPDLSSFGKVLSLGGGVAAPTSMFKSEIIKSVKGWDESLRYEDKPLWFKLSALGYKFQFRPEVSVLYRRNNSQVSNQFNNGDLVYQMQVYEKYSEYPEAKIQMKKILIMASSAKLDGVQDLKECIKIYSSKFSLNSLTLLLAKSGAFTLLARLHREISKAQLNKG